MKNVGSPQYEHLYSTIVNSASKHNTNEKPVSLIGNEKSEFIENINYRDVVNDKYTNVNIVREKFTKESTIEITVEKETVSNKSVVPKEVSELSSVVTIKSSLAKSKKSRQKKGKSVKRVRFSDDPESIPFWRRVVLFFHFLWNYTRNSVETLKTAKSKFIQYLPFPVLSLLISEVCAWQLN